MGKTLGVSLFIFAINRCILDPWSELDFYILEKDPPVEETVVG